MYAWLKAAVKPCGRKEYYSYIMVYVDDLLCIDLEPQQKYMDQVNESLKLKKGSVEKPKVCLGANCQINLSLTSGETCWGMSAKQYCWDEVKHVKSKLKESGHEFNKKFLSDLLYSPKGLFSNTEYKPELDATEPCNDDEAKYFMNLIGVLRWMCELGWSC